MDKRSHIRAVEGEPQETERLDQPPPVHHTINEDEGETEHPAPVETAEWNDVPETAETGNSAILPVVLGLLIAAWSAVFVWSHWSAIVGGAPLAQWVDWMATWAVPVLLVLAVWLVVLRSSAREATRFADVARSLSDESALLEIRLATINRELSLAREFLTTQSRELNYFGRAAAEGLTRHAQALDALLKENGHQFDAIESVSANALGNMEKLRDQLPVIANSSRDVSNQIGNAGRTAQDQLDEMISGFERLNEFGTASERQVVSLQERADEALVSLTDRSEKLGDVASERFLRLKADVEDFHSRMDEAETGNLSSLRGRFDDLQRELDALHASLSEKETEARDRWSDHAASLEERYRVLADDLAGRSEELAATQGSAIDALTAKLDAIDEGIEARRERHHTQLEALARDSEAVAERITGAGEAFDVVAEQAREAQGSLSTAVERLSGTLAESREALDGTDMAIAALTDSSVRLLELLQASSRQTSTEIPEALAASEVRITLIEERAQQIRTLLDEAKTSGATLSDSMDAVDARSRDALTHVEQLHSQFGEQADLQSDTIERLRERVAALAEENRKVAADAQNELRDAIATLEAAARSAFDAISDGQDEQIRAIASRVGEHSAAAIEQAVASHLEEAVTSLDLARERAAEAGRDATDSLRDELAKVNDLAENLETRVARARSEAQDRIDNDFSRRVALITESLNSNSIDVAKALSTDVADTAWASYLKGDRGIFTRRAVRLIENSEAREIAAIYNDDADFREHVNRYIHDFEAMLRTLLSTRDGNALSVTMLSSDMGKLYVILAQALERLRQ